jgi:hypothetical protein
MMRFTIITIGQIVGQRHSWRRYRRPCASARAPRWIRFCSPYTSATVCRRIDARECGQQFVGRMRKTVVTCAVMPCRLMASGFDRGTLLQRRMMHQARCRPVAPHVPAVLNTGSQKTTMKRSSSSPCANRATSRPLDLLNQARIASSCLTDECRAARRALVSSPRVAVKRGHGYACGH